MSGQLVVDGDEFLTWFGGFITWGPLDDDPIWPGEFVPSGESGTAWTWSIGIGSPVRELTAARGRVVTFKVAGHCFAQFTIDGRHDEATAIEERKTDLWLYRDGELRFRGRIAVVSDDVDQDRHVTQVTAVDYRGLLSLAAKVEPPVPVFEGVDQGQIAWELIEAWQSLPGAGWGIDEGVGATSGTLRDETGITAGSPIGELIDRISERDGGFEWAIEPDASGHLELNRWYPQRGVNNGIVLDYGGLIAKFRLATPEFGNVAIAIGDESTQPTVVETAGVAVDERGRWTVAEAFPTVNQQSTVDSKAVWLAEQAVSVEHRLALTFTPTRWQGRDHVWIGDIVTVALRSGRVQIAGPHRVVELQVVCGDDGTETVTAGVVGIEGDG